MSEQASKTKYLDAQQVIYLPRWAKFAVIGVLYTSAEPGPL